MSQYFRYISIDDEEFIRPPTSKTATGRITHPLCGGLLSYLLLDGPQDGTTFAGHNASPMNIGQGDLDGIDTSLFENEEGNLDRKRLARTVEAKKSIAERNEYAGRWSSSSITLAGDYSGQRVFEYTRPSYIVQLPGGHRHTHLGKKRPCNQNGEVQHDQPVTTDSKIKIRDPRTDDRSKVIADVLEVQEPRFDNITKEASEELFELIGTNWLDDQLVDHEKEHLENEFGITI